MEPEGTRGRKGWYEMIDSETGLDTWVPSLSDEGNQHYHEQEIEKLTCEVRWYVQWHVGVGGNDKHSRRGLPDSWGLKRICENFSEQEEGNLRDCLPSSFQFTDEEINGMLSDVIISK